jgi:4-amino-4-deoxy-L-arabinose transferase-like glycosyltransferase
VRPRPARLQQRRRLDSGPRLPLTGRLNLFEKAATRKGRGRDLVLIALLAGPILFAGIGNHHIWPFDEAFVAEIAREMHVSGDVVVPRLGGLPFLEKPPLHYAAIDAAYSAFGITPFAARLPGALAGLLTAGLTYALGRRLFDRSTGLYGALLLPTLYLFFHATHSCLIDATLALFVTAALLCAALLRDDDAPSWAVPMLYVAATLAFLTKGFVGPVLIGLGIGANALRERRWPGGRLRAHLMGVLILVGGMAAWGVALQAAGGAPYVREAYLANSLGRMFALPGLHPADDSLDNHTLPFWSLAAGLPGNLIPWTPLLLLALLPERFRRGRDAARPGGRFARGRAWLATIVLVDLLALSLAHQKRGMFVLPLFPLIALLLALEASRLRDAGDAVSRPVRLLVAVQVAAACLLAFLTVAVLLLVPAWASNRDPSPGAVVRAALLLGVVSLLAWRGALYWAAARWDKALRLSWGLVFVSVMGVASFLLPRVDSRVSFASFFENTRTLTDERAATPVLATGNEAFVGLADLSLEKTLPRAIRKPELMSRFESSSGNLYVITKDLALCDFGSDGPRARVRILVSDFSVGRSLFRPESLYLVELRRPEVSRPEVTMRR